MLRVNTYSVIQDDIPDQDIVEYKIQSFTRWLKGLTTFFQVVHHLLDLIRSPPLICRRKGNIRMLSVIFHIHEFEKHNKIRYLHPPRHLHPRRNTTLKCPIQLRHPYRHPR